MARVTIMGQNVTPKQRKAIEALTATGSVTKAAEVAKVTRKTVHTWMRQDAFKLLLDQTTQEAINALSRRLVTLAGKALFRLEEVIDDTDLTTTEKLRAFDAAVKHINSLRTLEVLEARVLELEKKVFDG